MLTSEELKKKEEYNREPVYYCKHCLSLKILTALDQDYCDDCGSSDIGITSIEDWEQMCIDKFGKSRYN